MHIHIPPLGWWEKLLDLLMVPVMYLVSGTFREAPQQTHRWNNIKLSIETFCQLDKNKMVRCLAEIAASKPWNWRLPHFHLPILGGWRKYVVLVPEANGLEWHVGWCADGHTIGISRITLYGPVRMLVGGGDVQFFAINANGEQITLNKIGEGTIGKGGEFSQIPLL